MKDFLQKVYNDFQAQEENWCELANSQFVSNNLKDKFYGGYDEEHIEQFYLLKYAPLYLEEYWEMYERFLDTYSKNTLRVLSVGVGAGLDYYGLVTALNNREIEMDYMGIDLVDWQYRHEEICFEQVDLKNISHNKRVMAFVAKGVDVVIFPKSIVEIQARELEYDAFSELCNVLVENDIDDIWFLNSYINTGRKISGLEQFEVLLHKMTEAGYVLKNGLDASKYYDSIKGTSVHYPINYRETWQQDLQNYCQRECGEEQSEICRLAQSPMLKKSYIAFGISNLKKAA